MNAATLPPAMRYNTELAKQAGQGARIESTAPYVGTLTKVKWVTKPTQTSGYEIDFKSEIDQTADRLYICVISADGSANTRGEADVAALLLCLGVKEAPAAAGQVEEWDFDARRKVTNNVYLFPAIMNKPVGLFLQKNIYTKTKDGSDGTNMNIVCSFRAADRKIAKEIIEKAPATHIDNLADSMGDKDSRTNKSAAGDSPYQHQPQPTGAPSEEFIDEFDDGGF